jgi:hypothetical protein
MRVSFCAAVAACCVIAMCASLSMAETINGPVYPAPGGNTYAGSGSNPAFGVKTGSYSGFDSSKYGSLWWGSSTAAGSDIQLAMDGSVSSSGEHLAFSSFSGGYATWTGSTQMQLSNGTYRPVSTEFVMWGTGLATAPAGIDNGVDVAVSGNFTVNYEFLANDNIGSGWVSPNQLYNQTQTYPNQNLQVISNFTGGFYYTDPATAAPLPGVATAGLALIGGLVAFKFFRRRATIAA